MNHNTLVIEIKSTLDKLIAARTSLGYDYIVYGLLLINEDQTRVSNITKALYIDFAAHYETSWSCVEKNIRNTVNAIWTSENKTILEMIFNRTYMDRKPTNKEFFEYLYDFIFLSQETAPTQSEENVSSIFSPCEAQKESIISHASDGIEITVGTPSAITGTPIVFSVISFL